MVLVADQERLTSKADLSSNLTGSLLQASRPVDSNCKTRTDYIMDLAVTDEIEAKKPFYGKHNGIRLGSIALGLRP